MYCRRSKTRLELDHAHPRAVGSDRVDNLVACCRDCNLAKSNQPIELFLADQPELLANILKRLQRSDMAHAAHVNAAPPAIVRDLRNLGISISSTDAASISWARQQLNIAPEWSGGEVYFYDLDLTMPNGSSETVRWQGYPAVNKPGTYQPGTEASINVKVVYETPNGDDVSSEAVTLTCTIAE